MEGRFERPAATADVGHDRHSPLLEERPEGIVRGVRGTEDAGVRWDHDRSAPELDCFFCDRDHLRRVGPRHIRDREQPTIGAAEVRHRAVEGTRATMEEFAVSSDELDGGERREYKLCFEAQIVHDAFAVLPVG